MDTQIIHNIILSKDESLEVKKKHPTKQPNYLKMGTGKMNKHNIESINLLNVMLNVTSASRRLIVTITDNMQYDAETKEIIFIVRVRSDIDIPAQQLKRAYKELNKLNIVRRVKRGYYMVNPHSVITDYEKQIAVWDSI